MNKKITLIFSIIFILPAWFQIPTYAADINGTSCKTAGKIVTQSGKSFTCVKSGKKLIWKIQKSSKSTSTIKPETSLPPLDNRPFVKSKYPELLIPQKVYKNLTSIAPTSLQINQQNLFLTEPFSQTDISVKLQGGLNEGLKFLSSIGFQIKSPFVIAFAQTNDWAKEILIKQGCQWEGLKTSDFKPLTWTGVKIPNKCSGNDGILREAIVQNIHTDGKSIESMHTLTHEAFHVWQSENVSTDFGLYPQNYFPRWFYESVPQALTVMAYANWNPDRSYDQWLDYWIENFRSQEKTTCLNSKIQDLIIPGSGIPGSDISTLCVYSKGVLAIDVLLANYGGLENLKKLYISHKIGQDFSVTFKEVTGKEINSFYEEVNQYFVERKWSSPN